MSVGGHVQSGESYEKAFRRESLEELNLDIDRLHWELLGNLQPKNHHVSAFMNVYQINSDVEPLYNRDDFISFEWILPQELLRRIIACDPAKGDLRKILEIFFDKTCIKKR